MAFFDERNIARTVIIPNILAHLTKTPWHNHLHSNSHGHEFRGWNKSIASRFPMRAHFWMRRDLMGANQSVPKRLWLFPQHMLRSQTSFSLYSEYLFARHDIACIVFEGNKFASNMLVVEEIRWKVCVLALWVEWHLKIWACEWQREI